MVVIDNVVQIAEDSGRVSKRQILTEGRQELQQQFAVMLRHPQDGV